jgi:hypothetical protein
MASGEFYPHCGDRIESSTLELVSLSKVTNLLVPAPTS